MLIINFPIGLTNIDLARLKFFKFDLAQGPENN